MRSHDLTGSRSEMIKTSGVSGACRAVSLTRFARCTNEDAIANLKLGPGAARNSPDKCRDGTEKPRPICHWKSSWFYWHVTRLP